MNGIFNYLIRFFVKHCHTITCTTFEAIIVKDRMHYLRRHVI